MNDDDDVPRDGLVKLTVYLTAGNYERLWTAAALLGESRTDVVNRALALYDELHRAEPGDMLTWTLVDGRKRTVVAAPPGGRRSLWIFWKGWRRST